MTLPSYIIQKLSSALEERKEIPMWGNLPSFPLSEFASLLKKTFGSKDLSIEISKADWISKEDLEDMLSSSLTPLYFCMHPLSPSFSLYLSNEDLEKFSVFVTDVDEKRTLNNQAFEKAFTQFIFLKVLKHVDELKVYEGLKVKLTTTPALVEESYTIDLAIRFSEKEIVAKLVLPKTFHHILTSHYASKPIVLQRLDSHLPLTLSVTAGKVLLDLKQIEMLELGDFVFLDQCYYHPDTHQGTLMLTFHSKTLMYVKRKNHEIKILDFAGYEYENPHPIGDAMDENEDILFPEEEPFEEELELNEEENLEENIPSSEPLPTAEKLNQATSVPLVLSVELAKITLPLSEILALSAGTLLKIPMNIEHHVSLVLNSQVVAKGQLVAVGDVVGVKISEVAK